MNLVVMLLAVTLFPVTTMAMLMWLTHLEDTLPGAVRSARHSSPPPPILAIPVQAPVHAPVPAPVRTPGLAVREEAVARVSTQRSPAGVEVRPAR